jgi:2-polyprenyl-6-methoxyphenol hydroxylase-like FAD-dependent oxidoreductase
VAHVIVVGAGPAGAALAYLLARRGCGVTLLERHTDFAREFRGEVLLPGGLLALDQMGLLPTLEEVPHVTLDAFEIYLNGRQRARVVFDPGIFGPHPPQWMSQPGLLELLCARAGEYGCFRLERGVTGRGLLVEGGRVVGVRVLAEAGERELHGDLVVGADGRSSMVRARADLPVDRDPTPMDVVWCKVPMPDFMGARPALRAFLGHGHILLAAPVYDGTLQMAWIIRKGTFGEIRERGMAWCLDRMAHHVSPDLAFHLREHRNDAIEPFLLVTVSDHVREWTRPGLLVLGDAAHTMSPVGAQGLNIALRDAIVAANHLVPVLGSGAVPEVIDAATRRIEEERVPEVARIQRIQAQPPKVLFNDAWWARLLVRTLAPLAMPQLARGQRSALFGELFFGVTPVELRV